MRRSFSFLTLLVCFAAAAHGAQPATPLTLTISGASLTVNGLTPGAPVYLFGVARETFGFDTNVQPHETKLVDDDRDGKVEWTLRKPIALQSIWFAVDLSNGVYASASPAGYRRAHALPSLGEKLKKNTVGDVIGAEISGWNFECAVVRPKSDGIWRGTVISRGGLDHAGINGKVRFSFAEFSGALGTTDPPPPSLKHDDVILVVNSFAGEFAAYRVGE